VVEANEGSLASLTMPEALLRVALCWVGRVALRRDGSCVLAPLGWARSVTQFVLGRHRSLGLFEEGNAEEFW